MDTEVLNEAAGNASAIENRLTAATAAVSKSRPSNTTGTLSLKFRDPPTEASTIGMTPEASATGLCRGLSMLSPCRRNVQDDVKFLPKQLRPKAFTTASQKARCGSSMPSCLQSRSLTMRSPMHKVVNCAMIGASCPIHASVLSSPASFTASANTSNTSCRSSRLRSPPPPRGNEATDAAAVAGTSRAAWRLAAAGTCTALVCH
mmetsp:Transcript_11208/g.32337  ORF Transcript_11208/g.32337 Transcript_11208/m.32337 type:complete len:204 (+) Transcript_11208:684-1295(+)